MGAANTAFLIIADLTDASSVLWELGVILPQVPATPVLPIILKNSPLPEMIREDLNRYDSCVLGLIEYEEDSINNELPKWVKSAEEKAKKLKKFRLPTIGVKNFKQGGI